MKERRKEKGEREKGGGGGEDSRPYLFISTAQHCMQLWPPAAL